MRTIGTTRRKIARVTAAATYPTANIVMNANGKPVYPPNKLVVRSGYGCNFTITNTTANVQTVLYGMPGAWKVLESIAPGASGGAGIGIPMTTYFGLNDNQSTVLRVACR